MVPFAYLTVRIYQFQFNALRSVMAVHTQGNHYDPPHVKDFRMEYSEDCVTFRTVNDANGVSAVICPLL